MSQICNIPFYFIYKEYLLNCVYFFFNKNFLVDVDASKDCDIGNSFPFVELKSSSSDSNTAVLHCVSVCLSSLALNRDWLYNDDQIHI